MSSTLNINNASATNMAAWPSSSAPANKDTDVSTGQKESIYMNEEWTKQWGYFNSHPELKAAILMKAIWTVGKGYTCENVNDEVTLDLITGFGKSTFNDILFNMKVVSLVGRDAYCEIIRDSKSGKILNLKPLNTGSMRHVYDEKGMLKRYEQVTRLGEKESIIKFKPEDIFHISNDMLADQCRGISVIESLDKTILADLESFEDTRKVMHQQAKPFIIFKLKTDDATKIANIKSKIDNLRKLGEDLFIPDDDNTLTHEVVQVNPSQMILAWRQDITNRFYRALGMPLVLFGSANSTESGSKMEYFGHETVFEFEQRKLEQDVWRQLRTKIDLVSPTSMAPELAQDTMKDGMDQQMGMQPSDTMAGVGR